MMSTLKTLWRIYRWVALITGSIILLGLSCTLGYKAVFDPDTVSVTQEFAAQQLGIPCASIELTRGKWDKSYHIFSAVISSRQAGSADSLSADLTAAGWVEQPGMPGARRIFERRGLTLLIVLPDSLLAFPTWMTAQNTTATQNLRTLNDVRKLSRD